MGHGLVGTCGCRVWDDTEPNWEQTGLYGKRLRLELADKWNLRLGMLKGTELSLVVGRRVGDVSVSVY